MNAIGKLSFFAIATMLIQSSALSVDLHWSVYDKKTDKELLHFDHQFVENAAGKRIMYWDGNRLENADGAALLDFDGDTTSGFSIRPPKDPYFRILWCNGTQLCKKVDEDVVFEYDGDNRYLALEHNGKSVYTLSCHNGNLESRLESWQLVAIAYALQPKLFVVDEALAKAQREAAAMAEKETDDLIKNRLFGEFTIINSNAKPFDKGKVGVAKVGKYIYMNYELAGGKKLQGIGVHMSPGLGNDSEQILTALNEDGAVALGIYKIENGKLDGTWYPTTLLADGTTSLGHEKLTGKTKEDLSGKFTITEATTPGKNEPYKGILELKKIERNDSSSTPAYLLTWTLGTIKLNGIGVQIELYDSETSNRIKYLVVAAGSGDVIVGQHFATGSSDTHLDFAVLGRSIAGENTGGYINLMK